MLSALSAVSILSKLTVLTSISTLSKLTVPILLSTLAKRLPNLFGLPLGWDRNNDIY